MESVSRNSKAMQGNFSITPTPIDNSVTRVRADATEISQAESNTLSITIDTHNINQRLQQRHLLQTILYPNN